MSIVNCKIRSLYMGTAWRLADARFGRVVAVTVWQQLAQPICSTVRSAVGGQVSEVLQ